MAGTDGSAALQRLEDELTRRSYEIAAFIFEPLIQGAAGMLVQPPDALGSARDV